MKKLLLLVSAFLIAIIILSAPKAHCQELFKPGSTYLAGTLVKDVYGTTWKVRQRIGIAVSPPSANAYYAYVKAGEPTAGGEVYAVNVQERGVLPANTAQQNSTNLQALINSYPENSGGSIYIPSGDYNFSTHISLQKRPLHIFGDNGTIWGKGTNLYFPKEQAGMLIVANGAIIENLALIGGGNQTEWMDGILIRGIVTLRGVYVKGFYNGIEAACNITTEGTNCSGMLIEKCFAIENTNNGFHFQGEDANAITVIGCDSRDNKGYGFYDGSFLGNYFVGCMAHDNVKGHYFVRDKANARSSFISCYGEGGSPVNSFSPKTTVQGGFLANGYTLDGKTIINQ